MNIIDQFFEKLNHLPMLPKAVQDTLRLMQDDDVNVSHLAESIGRDQTLIVRVLRMANSAHFGSVRNIKTIPEAVSLIGLKNLKTLIVAAGVTSTFASVPGLNLTQFWRHNLITAVLARAIAKDAKVCTETAYIAGLMHSVGQIPLYLVFPMAAKQVDETCKDRSVLERKSVELALLGIDHCQVGEVLAKKWNFPEEVQHVIRNYTAPLNKDACEFSPVVYAAVHIAFDILHEKENDYIATTLNSEVREKLGWQDTKALIQKIESFMPVIAEAEQYL